MSGFEDWMAGARPKITPVTTARSVVNASTRAIDCEILSDRERQLQICGDQRVEQPVGEQQAEAAAGQGEQRALGDELPDQTCRARAEREPQRDFLAPARRRARAAGWRRSRKR